MINNWDTEFIAITFAINMLKKIIFISKRF